MEIDRADSEFDFVRYFTRVQQTPFWHEMQIGMAEFAGVQPGMRVLDVGCGPGRLVDYLCQLEVNAVGADGDLRMVEQARRLYGERPYYHTQAENLPWYDNQFDVVMAGNLLFFLPDPLLVLREMVRVVKVGGWVTLWNPSEQLDQTAAAHYAAAQSQWDGFAQKHLVNWASVAENNRRWSKAELARLFKQTGLTQFACETTLGDLARYAKGKKGVNK